MPDLKEVIERLEGAEVMRAFRERDPNRPSFTTDQPLVHAVAQVDGHDGPNAGHRRKFVGAPDLGVFQARKSRRTSRAYGGLAGEKICEKSQSSSAKFRFRCSLLEQATKRRRVTLAEAVSFVEGYQHALSALKPLLEKNDG